MPPTTTPTNALKFQLRLWSDDGKRLGRLRHDDESPCPLKTGAAFCNVYLSWRRVPQRYEGVVSISDGMLLRTICDAVNAGGIVRLIGREGPQGELLQRAYESSETEYRLALFPHAPLFPPAQLTDDIVGAVVAWPKDVLQYLGSKARVMLRVMNPDRYAEGSTQIEHIFRCWQLWLRKQIYAVDVVDTSGTVISAHHGLTGSKVELMGMMHRIINDESVQLC